MLVLKKIFSPSIIGDPTALTFFSQLIDPVFKLYEKIDGPAEKIISSSVITISDDIKKSVASGSKDPNVFDSRAVAWIEDEVDQWVEDRIEDRDTN